MLRQCKNAWYVIRHSSGALLLLAACLLVAWLLGNDIGRDAVKDMKALNNKIEFYSKSGRNGLEVYQSLHELEGITDPEEFLDILKKRQILGAPNMTINGMSLLILILPGIVLTPGLTKSRGLGRELQYWGRGSVPNSV